MTPLDDGWEWRAKFDLTVNFPGLENDPVPDLRVNGATNISFDGFIVVPDNLFPKPRSEQEAASLLADHVDINDTFVCKDEDWRYVFQKV